jgi:hypothetical protein
MADLLPGESIVPVLHVGQRVIWNHIQRGGYGYIESVPATVLRIGKRVTIEVRKANGDAVKRAVQHVHLKPAPTPEPKP